MKYSIEYVNSIFLIWSKKIYKEQNKTNTLFIFIYFRRTYENFHFTIGLDLIVTDVGCEGYAEIILAQNRDMWRAASNQLNDGWLERNKTQICLISFIPKICSSRNTQIHLQLKYKVSDTVFTKVIRKLQPK